METFSLEGRPYVALHNLLQLTGICCSGGIAKRMIDEGLVMVDGKPETRKRCKIRPGQVVSVEGRNIVVA